MDRQQLVGTLAVKTGLIDAGQLEQAQRTLQASQSIADALVQQGHLTDGERDHLEYLAERSMERQSSPMSLDDCNLTPPPMPPEEHTLRTPTVSLTAGDTLAAPIDRYCIRNLHATGGIGRVWVAYDTRLQRDVALKDLRPDSAVHTQLCQRFLEEGRVTGQLEHPGIVPVYEMGTRPHDGQPYYIMRFVKGRTLAAAIHDFHKKHKSGKVQGLDFRQLLQDFVAICKTVAFAHSRGVLHRDLKPANILIGDFGEVLVLDWGLARTGERRQEAADGDPESGAPAVLRQRPVILGQEGGVDNSATRAGQVLGTPAYMAPEQAAGQVDRLDERTDVWGLGAILYELLTAQPPFTGGAVEEILRKVREQHPPPPRSVNRTLPPSLEAVCMKALAKDPNRRYAAATTLAAEVQAWLADEPVSARRDPMTTRLARWARRHKAVVAGAGALLVTGIIALTITSILVDRQRALAESNLVLANEAREQYRAQRQRAEANLHTALDAVEKYYVQVSENRLLDEPGMQPLRHELLQSAREFGERFVRENKDDPHRKADLARMLVLLARATSQTGRTDKALEPLDQAQQLYEELHEADSADNGWRRGLGECLLLRGFLHFKAGDFAKAAEAFTRAGDKLEKLPVDDRGQEKLALVYNNLGLISQGDKRWKEAEGMLKQSLKIRQAIVARDRANLVNRLDLAGVLNNLGTMYGEKKDLVSARTMLEKSVALRTEILQEGHKSLALRADLAQSYTNLGYLALKQTQQAEAEKQFAKALDEYQALTNANPMVHSYRHSLATTHYTLAQAFGKRSAFALAHQEIDKALAHFEQLRRELPGEEIHQLWVGRVLLARAYFYNDDQKPDDADKALRAAMPVLESLKVLLKTDGSAKNDLLNAHWTHAQVLHGLERYADAMPHWDRALEFVDDAQRELVRKERTETMRKLKK